MMLEQVQKLIDPVRRRVMNLVLRGILKTVDDSKSIQRLQVAGLSEELLDQVDRVSEYGFFSVPLVGSECLVVFLGGNRSHGVVVGTEDRRTRPANHSAGDVGLWNAAGVKLALLNASKNVELTGLNKFKVQNATAELVATLSELCQFLIDCRVQTVLGPQPLIDPNDTMPAIKAKIDSFKE